MKRTVWFVISSVIVALLILSACAPAPATPTTPTTPATPTPPAKPTAPTTPATPTTPAAPAGPEMLKWSGKKVDGTVVEKLIEKPRYGGVFTMVLASGPQYFDEAYGGTWNAPSLHWTNEDLTTGDWTRGPSGTRETDWVYHKFQEIEHLVGQLAESWDYSTPDTIIFQIRKGIRFQDKPPVNGREMNADDVAFSLRRLWEKKTSYHSSAFPYLINMQKLEESIYASDKWTVVVKTQPGRAGQVWETVAGLARIVPREIMDDKGYISDWKKSNGTGPFILTDYVPDASLTGVRNPNYWMKDPFFQKDQLPYLDGIKYLVIPDLSTRMAALRTGKIDWHASVPLEQGVSLIKTDPQLKYFEWYTGSVMTLHGRLDTPPFNDIRVRRALAMAIDQQKIGDALYAGRAQLLVWPAADIREFKDVHIPLKDLPVSVREQFEYHPDKAKQLLAEAGYPKGFKTEIIATSGFVDILSIVKEYWADIGVELDIQVKETAAYTSIYAGKTYKQMLAAGSHIGTMPFKFVFERPGNMFNHSLINDPYLNEKIAEIDANYFNYAKSRQLMREVIPYMLEQAWNIQLPAGPVYQFWQPWLKGYGGELKTGVDHHPDWHKYIWIDRDLREKMTGRR